MVLNKSKQRTLIVIILVLFFLQNIGLIIINTNSINLPKENSPIANNIGAPNYWYTDMVIEESNAYLFGFDFIDVIDISNPENIVRNTTYTLDLSFGPYYYRNYCFYNLTNGKFYCYRIVNEEENCQLVYNEYELENNSYTMKLETTTNLTIGNRFKNSYMTQKSNTLQIVLTENNHADYYNVSLMTVDISNKSQPIIETHIHLHEEINFTIWGNPYYYVFDYQDIVISNGYLFLTRAWRTYNYTDYFASSECVFAYGFMKIWDINNASNPQLVNFIELKQWSYSSVIVYNNLLFYSMNDYGYLVYNCTNPANLELITSYQNNESPRYFTVKDDVLYMVYSEKIEIIDISNIQRVKELSHYVPNFQGNGYFGKGIVKDNYLFVTRSSEVSGRSFYVFDCSNLNNIKRLYPEGTYISAEFWMKFVLYSIFWGPVIVIIIIVVVIVVVVQKRRKKKEKIKLVDYY
ncbi:MAG: hypothetical protein HZR80_10180 [Candidatus Heimdallarchaeota archaeon]